MYLRLVSIGLFVYLLSNIIYINGEANDELKNQHTGEHANHHAGLHQKSHKHVHQTNHESRHKSEEKHHYHHVLGLHQIRHHKGLKTREQNGNCTTYCLDEKSIAVLRSFSTKELEFLYNISKNPDLRNDWSWNLTSTNVTPPVRFDSNSSFSYTIAPNISTYPINGTNFTVPVPGSNNVNTSIPKINATSPGNTIPIPFLNLTSIPFTLPFQGLPQLGSEYPIFSSLARRFGNFLAGVLKTIGNIFLQFPLFIVMWLEFLSGFWIGMGFSAHNMTCMCDKIQEALTKLLQHLTFCSGAFGINLCNFTNGGHFPIWNNISATAQNISGDIQKLIPSWGLNIES